MADHGYAPYQESAFRSALRLLGAAGRGAASVPGLVDPQSSGFGNALQGFGGGFGSEIKASSAARLVAQQYAEKRHAEERQAAQDEIHNKYLDALTKRAERPEIPPKPEKHVPTMAEKRAEAEAMLGRRLTDEEARKLAGVHFNPPKTAAGAVPKPPKPDKISRRIPKDFTEQGIIDEILAGPPSGKVGDPRDTLAKQQAWFHWATGLGNGAGMADSPAIRAAARHVLRTIQSQGR